MKFTSSLIVLLTLTGIQICNGQEINWKNTRNWKLYNIHNRAGFTYTVDTLNSFQSIGLDDNIMKAFLSNVSEWPKEKYSVWMGLYVATCEPENSNIVRKIIISTYGGFFFDEATKRYYQLPLDLREQWFRLLNDNSKKISND